MTKDNLIVKDSEYTSAGKHFKAYCSILEDTLAEYKNILTNISENAIVSGEVHDAICEFLKYVENLQRIVANLGIKFQRMTTNFIKEIDKADDYLYVSGISKVRDFSDSEKERLMKCLDNPWCSITDNFGDWSYGLINKVVDIFDWEEAKAYLEKSKRFLLDYNDETAAGLEILFRRVYAIDSKYGKSIAGVGAGDFYTAYFGYVILTLCAARDFIKNMAEVINPSKGYFKSNCINEKLGEAYKDLLYLYNETMDIAEPNEKPKISIITNFVSYDWSARYFDRFHYPISDYITDIGGIDALKMVVFNMFGIAKDKALPGNYEDYLRKEQLLKTLEELAQNSSFSESDEKELIDECEIFLKYVKKYGDECYKYMNEHRLNNGNLIIDGRTKIGKEFTKFLEQLGNAKYILKYGEKGVELLARFLAEYTKGLELIQSFKANYYGDEKMLNCIDEVENLFTKEFMTWMSEVAETAGEIGIDFALSELGKVVPVVAVVKSIEESLDIFGEITGIGIEAKSMYDVLTYYELYSSSSAAYRNAWEKVRLADPNDEEYQTLTDNLYNCFILHRKNLIEMYDAMSESTNGNKKSYYNYCAREAECLDMTETMQPDLLTYEEFINLF